MTTFAWLIIGHLVGDWLLQSDWMAKGKKRSLFNFAGLIHYTIYAATIISALLPTGVRDRPPAFYLMLGVIIFASHWLIDATHLVEGWMRLCRQTNREMIRLMVDQTLHILVLVVLAASI